MSVQNASVVVPVSVALLEWARGPAGIGGLDAMSDFLYNAQDLFIALLTGEGGFVAPGSSFDLGLLNGGAELAGNGYLRANVGFGNSVWSVDQTNNPNIVSNLASISFGLASGDWLAASQLMIFDHSSGNLLEQAPLAAGVTVLNGNNLTFAPGSLQLAVQL